MDKNEVFLTAKEEGKARKDTKIIFNLLKQKHHIVLSYKFLKFSIVKTCLYILFLLAFVYRSSSQNLIPNPSFEEINKSNGPANWEMTAWSPDYYSLNLPTSDFNKKEYLTPFGNSYIGMLDCECISIKLYKPLIKDQEYFIRIYVAKPENFCPSGVKRITVAFTKGKLPRKEGSTSSYYAIKYIPMYSEDFKPVKKKGNWVEFSVIYKAKGEETYFNIGDFGKVLTDAGKKPNEGEDIIEIDSLNIGKCDQKFYDNISVELSPFQKNVPNVIDSIFFETNKSSLLPKSYKSLDRLYGLILKLDKTKIKIIGHTDNIGDKTKNKALSKDRANSVLNYLVKKGIPKVKLVAIGMGDTKPLAENNSEEGRAKNRRVEIEVLE